MLFDHHLQPPGDNLLLSLLSSWGTEVDGKGGGDEGGDEGGEGLGAAVGVPEHSSAALAGSGDAEGEDEGVRSDGGVASPLLENAQAVDVQLSSLVT